VRKDQGRSKRITEGNDRWRNSCRMNKGREKAENRKIISLVRMIK